MTDGALVLEGGSLRCLFTAGVLDVFLENRLDFSYVSGVSAGALCAMSYVSGQVGRSHDINIRYIRDKRYLSLRGMLKSREVYNFGFVFGELSQNLEPFDREVFEASRQRLVVVGTRCRTGKPEYFERGKCADLEAAVAASSSMPIMSRMVTVDHKKYLDGGLSMPIPYRRAMDEGYEKVVLVLSRHRGYRKPPFDRLERRAYERYFAPLPELLKTICDIPQRYNQMLDEIEDLEQAGKIFVIRPPRPVTVSRLERDRKKLENLYREGREEGERRLKELQRYVAGESGRVNVDWLEKQNM